MCFNRQESDLEMNQSQKQIQNQENENNIIPQSCEIIISPPAENNEQRTTTIEILKAAVTDETSINGIQPTLIIQPFKITEIKKEINQPIFSILKPLSQEI